jgi:hypothetical protein
VRRELKKLYAEPGYFLPDLKIEVFPTKEVRANLNVMLIEGKKHDTVYRFIQSTKGR